MQKQEILEIWDWQTAQPTGKTVERNQAHVQSIPHECVHLWLFRVVDGVIELIFQERAATKDNYPNCLDISVAGHVPFGLEEGKVAKEAEEELGIEIDESALIHLGIFRYEEQEEKYFQREFQQVYLLQEDRPLDCYVFQDGEVSGVAFVKLDDLQKLLAAEHNMTIEIYHGNSIITRNVSRRDFHPLLFSENMRIYMKTLFKALHEYIETGEVKSKLVP